MLNLYIYTQNIETEKISWLAEVGVSTASIYWSTPGNDF